MEVIFQFVASHLRIFELIVFWYPVGMSLMWIVGSIIYYWRIERKEPLPLPYAPMVSILVPTYNESAQVAETVERLSHLNYPDYEIILINDGSSDNTSEIEHEIVKTNPKVRLIDLKENCGKANALDLGSCWINQLRWLKDNPVIMEYLYELGLHEDEAVFGSLSIGYADSEDGLPNRREIPIKGNEVTYIG